MSFAVTAKLICVFVFAYAKIWFSHDAAHIKLSRWRIRMTNVNPEFCKGLKHCIFKKRLVLGFRWSFFYVHCATLKSKMFCFDVYCHSTWFTAIFYCLQSTCFALFCLENL